MGKKLIIAEKPSVGMTIAKAVGAKEKFDGYLEGDDYVVSWCMGHLIQLASPEKYDGVSSTWVLEELPIIPDKWQYEIGMNASKQLNVLKTLFLRKDITSLVEATDAGREGELIFRLVYMYLGCKKPFERLWISSLEESAIKKGLKDLKPSTAYDNLYCAALARARADWLYGMNGSRLYSITKRIPNASVLSVGRVQTPTLAMIVKRQEEIDNFKVEKRWAVVKIFQDGWKLETEKFTKENEALNCLNICSGLPTTITSVEKKKKKASPPLLFSLTSLQQEMNRRSGFSASKTLEIIQKLYERKILSYPRTDSNYITEDMASTFSSIVNNLAKIKDPSFQIVNLKGVVNDAKVSDHYAIITTMLYSKEAATVKLSDEEKEVVSAIVQRMFESVSPWYEFEECKVTGETAEFIFTGTGRTTLKEGWRAIAKKFSRGTTKDSGSFPTGIAEGMTYTAEETSVESRDTEPPKPYTEDTLLGAMERAGAKEFEKEVERKGLGTSATRAAIIEILIRRNYITREKKKILPTEAGKQLIAIVTEKLKSVDTTVDWENVLLDVEKGRTPFNRFYQSIVDEVSTLVTKLASDAIKENAAVKSLGKCPFCGSEMKDRYGMVVCQNRECGKVIIRNSKLLCKDPLDDARISKLLAGESVSVTAYSPKKDKTFSAKITIDREKSQDQRYIGFSLELPAFTDQPPKGKTRKAKH